MVGLQTLDLAIGVRVPASQPTNTHLSIPIGHFPFVQLTAPKVSPLHSAYKLHNLSSI
jgi:hypothetical protein